MFQSHYVLSQHYYIKVLRVAVSLCFSCGYNYEVLVSEHDSVFLYTYTSTVSNFPSQ